MLGDYNYILVKQWLFGSTPGMRMFHMLLVLLVERGWLPETASALTIPSAKGGGRAYENLISQCENDTSSLRIDGDCFAFERC